MKSLCTVSCLLLVASCKSPKGVEGHKGNIVPDTSTAIQIARAIWSPIYGAEKIEHEKPFEVRETKKGVWIVNGTLPKIQREDHAIYASFGGSAYIEIRKLDGKILKVYHGK